MARDHARVILRVAQIWDNTMLDERIYRRGGVVVGTGPRSDFATPDVGLPRLFKLFRKRWRGWSLVLAPGMSGEVSIGGEVRRVPDILAGRDEWSAVALAASDWGVVRLGDHGFFFNVAAPAGQLDRGRGRRTGYARPSSAYSLSVHGLLLAITFLFSTWPPPGGSTLGGYVIHLSEEAPKIAPPEEKKKAAGNAEGEPKAKPAATADKEGKSGGEGKKPRATQSSPKADPRAAIVKKVADQGVLKFQGSLARIAGPSQEDARLQMAMARVGDKGYGSGHGYGVGPGTGTGTSTRGGTGYGGGGHSTSELVTRGPIDTGTGRGPRGTPSGTKVVETKVPPFKTEAADTSGGMLTPEQVRAVVERHRSALQWCFEKELQKNPKLSGKVVVFWQINAPGDVDSSKIKSSTIGSPDVEDCLVRQVRKWTFPTAENGQITKVFYPFVFSAR